MNREKLCNEFANWLIRERVEFSRANEHTFDVRVTGQHGLVILRIVCEEEPSLLQMVCLFPLFVPKEKVADTALILHKLNTALRIGSFYLMSEHRTIHSRLVFPIRPEADLAEQFSPAFHTAASCMDDHMRTLALLLCNTTEVAQSLAELKPEETIPSVIALPSGGGRIQFN